MRIGTALSVILVFIAALAVIAWGLFSQVLLLSPITAGDFGWHVFAFSSGLLLIGSPAVLPFALAMIPLALKRRVGSAIVLTFAFSVGVLLALTSIGFFTGFLGYIAYDIFALPLHTFSSIGYLLLGIFAYTLALGEIDLMYIVRGLSGDRIANIFTRESGAFGAFLLGLFLSCVNIHPSTLILLGDAMVKGDPLSGASLLLMHGLGRIIPLLIVVTLAALSVDASDWLTTRKDRMRTLLGWLLIIVSSSVLYIGIIEQLTLISGGAALPHLIEQRTLLALFWLVPLWVLYHMESRRVYGGPVREWKLIDRSIALAEKERRGLRASLHFPMSEHTRHLAQLEKQIDVLEKKRRILESALRHSVEEGLRSKVTQRLEERLLMMRFAFTIVSSLLVVTILSLFTF